MKKLLFLLLPIGLLAQGPQGYWQQEVKYTMNIDFDVEKHQFIGVQELVYFNNSPDTLKQVFYHLYFNAFQPGSMMDERSKTIADVDKRIGTKIGKLKKKEVGYHYVQNLKHNGEDVIFTINETLLQAFLQTPIAPGDSAVFSMNFNSQVPKQIRRSGRDNAEGVDYTMTQWYPKLAEYDKDGWHPEPYIAREYYGVFGSFDVSINIDQKYKLGGTGTLDNPEGKWIVTSEKEGVKSYDLVPNKMAKRTWKFHAEDVHDFAWAADEDFIRTSTIGPNELELNFFYLEGDWQENWQKLPAYTVRFFELMNEHFGEYLYPQFSVIQGGDGGMEYPMCTMLKGTGKLPGLIGVMVHESAHNWYYGMLASNEFQYPWMDEGFTSYAEEEVLNIIFGKNEINPHNGAYRGHKFLILSEQKEPLSTPSDYFTTNRNYGISAYSRGQVFLAQLRFIVGDETFAKIMLEYYAQWNLKHPDPWDFIKVAEEVSNIQLDWYLNYWLNTTKAIDYAIVDIDKNKPGTDIILQNNGSMPMPVELVIEMENGIEFTYHIPLVSMFGHKNTADILYARPWPWTNKNYTLTVPYKKKEIKKITLNKEKWVADINSKNDVWPEVKEKKD